MSNTDNAAQGHAADLNEPAFPIRDGIQEYQFGGMSLRDYFAAKALPVCYAEACKEMEKTGWVVDWRIGVAIDTYRMADAMLAARTGARDDR